MKKRLSQLSAREGRASAKQVSPGLLDTEKPKTASDGDDSCDIESTSAKFKHTGHYLDLKSQAARSASTWGAISNCLSAWTRGSEILLCKGRILLCQRGKVDILFVDVSWRRGHLSMLATVCNAFVISEPGGRRREDVDGMMVNLLPVNPVAGCRGTKFTQSIVCI